MAALWRVGLALLALPSAALAQTLQMHGSGTTNPSKLIWDVLATFEARAKLPMHATYRAVGSSTGQKEFVGDDASGYKPYNDFGSGDIPMTQERYDSVNSKNGQGSVVHIPFAVGAIAVFVNLGPGGPSKVNLNGCVLARIFGRQIKSWDDAAITALNPGFTVPAGQSIYVAHRVYGSSSTSGLTTYLEKHAAESCADAWTLGAGSTIDWPTDTVEVEGSGGMAKYLEETPYSIGYLDAGHGHSLGLSEVALENRDGVSLTSKEANIGAAAAQAVTGGVIPADPTASFASVALFDLPGPTTWPISMLSYFYVRTDLTDKTGDNFALLKSFIEYVAVSSEGQKTVTDYGFVPIPPELVTYNTNTMKKLRGPPNAPAFVHETADSTQVIAGAKDYVISGKRKSTAEVQLSQLSKDLAAAMAKINALEKKVSDHHDDSDDAIITAKKDDGNDRTETLAIVAIVMSSIAILASVALPQIFAHRTSKDAGLNSNPISV